MHLTELIIPTDLITGVGSVAGTYKRLLKIRIFIIKTITHCSKGSNPIYNYQPITGIIMI